MKIREYSDRTWVFACALAIGSAHLPSTVLASPKAVPPPIVAGAGVSEEAKAHGAESNAQHAEHKKHKLVRAPVVPKRVPTKPLPEIKKLR